MVKSDQIRSDQVAPHLVPLNFGAQGGLWGNRTVPGTASRGKVLGGLRPVES